MGTAERETTKALKEAEAKLRRARSTFERARVARDRLVLQAIDEGMRPADVARATGLTRGRITQIQAGD
jgi:hypothetical protein